MEGRLSDLRYKEVINIADGARLGWVGDGLLDPVSGKLTALIVPGPPRLFGLLGREEDYVLPWSSILRMGEDMILIDSPGELRRGRRSRSTGEK